MPLAWIGENHPSDQPAISTRPLRFSFTLPTTNDRTGEVLAIIGQSHVTARRLLTEHRAALDALAEALLKRETLDEQEILAVTGLKPAPPLETNKLPLEPRTLT